MKKLIVMAAAGLLLAGCGSTPQAGNTAVEGGAEAASDVSSEFVEPTTASGEAMTGIDAATGSAAGMPEDSGPILRSVVANDRPDHRPRTDPSRNPSLEVRNDVASPGP